MTKVANKQSRRKGTFQREDNTESQEPRVGGFLFVITAAVERNYQVKWTFSFLIHNIQHFPFQKGERRRERERKVLNKKMKKNYQAKSIVMLCSVLPFSLSSSVYFS